MAIINVKAERRKDFIEKFEKKGYKIDKIFTKEEIIKSKLPITIDFKTKEIGRMGNVTCAAAAVSCKAVKTEEEFIEQYTNLYGKKTEYIYSIEEEYSDGSSVTEFFNTRREDALKYLKQRASICDGLYKGWKKESGINSYKWSKGEKWVKLGLEMVEVEE